jgi:CRISPR/Cas system endoribonuclease Cas6 (RAMP superfamily)
MLTVTGLGRQRETVASYELFVDDVRANDAAGHITVPDLAPRTIEPTRPPAPALLRLRLYRPLRLKYNNRFVRTMEHLHLHTIVHSIHQRYLQLSGAPAARLGYRVEGQLRDRFGTFEDLTRYSTRNKGTLQVGGMIGEMIVEGIDDRSYGLLKLGEIIGAGKQTVFGLGKIQVDII